MNLKQIKNVPGARKAPMPQFVQPQLATLVKEAPKGDQWLHELKFDGYRLLCHLHRGRVRLWTRNQKDWTSKFPNVVKALQSLPVQSAILDAEVVALDSSGRSSFQMLQQAIHKTGGKGLVLEVFDVIYLEGFNLTRTPLVERKRLLRAIVPKRSASMLCAAHDLFARSLALPGEAHLRRARASRPQEPRGSRSQSRHRAA